MVITNLPVKIPDLDAWFTCVAGKSVPGRAGGYLELFNTDIAVPMPVVSAERREYLYAVMDDYTCAVYTRGGIQHNSVHSQ